MAEEINNTSQLQNLSDVNLQIPQNILKQLESQFLLDNLSSISYKGALEDYYGSEKQKLVYENLKQNDQDFKKYIESEYGSYESFSTQKNIQLSNQQYDPFTDYNVDVNIISADGTIYTASHISSKEVIVELLTGICTFYYIKVNGGSGKSVGSLNAEFIPDIQYENRGYFFRALSGDRVGLWDINKQKWNSFYMSRLIKFIRDEKSSIE